MAVRSGADGLPKALLVAVSRMFRRFAIASSGVSVSGVLC
jgi:hypothetical protein